MITIYLTFNLINFTIKYFVKIFIRDYELHKIFLKSHKMYTTTLTLCKTIEKIKFTFTTNVMYK